MYKLISTFYEMLCVLHVIISSEFYKNLFAFMILEATNVCAACLTYHILVANLCPRVNVKHEQDLHEADPPPAA